MYPRPILASVLIVLVAGCQAPGSRGASPSASELVSTRPSASTAPSASILPFPSVELPPQSIVELTVALDISDLPTEPPSGTLDAGRTVVIASGPRDVGGQTWYALVFAEGDASRQAWARIDEATAVTMVDLPCPAKDDILGVGAWDRLRCFGDATVSVEGTVGHCQGGVVLVEPGWLGYACWAVSDELGTLGTLGLHASPESGITFPDDRVRARITGHFDDPASTTCVYLGEPDPAGGTPSASEQVFLCREAFVVDKFEVLEVLGPNAAG